jgi:uncharacterized protein (TIGR00299 family) protein
MRILYYDCFAGISGDMNLGAMLDLGVDPKHLEAELAKLPLSGYALRYRRDERRGLSGMKVDVVLDDHHHHHRDHGHEDHHHDAHRNYGDIRRIISESGLSARAQELSQRIFAKLAEAEAKIHGLPPEEVHFHEVGALDSIVDIVGAAICFEALGVDEVLASPVELGKGLMQCEHGTFPVPAPATAEILKGLPVRTGTVPHEATTPTGAAIIATLADRFVDTARFAIERVGYGIGSRDCEIPNVLRAILATSDESCVKREAAADENGVASFEATLVECNLDDMVPERYDFVMELLFQAGAKDVFLTPIVMKKSRPAVVLSVLSDATSLPAVRDILFTHTTTLGIRERAISKRMLSRTERTCATPYGELRVKDASYRGRVVRSKPEYEDLKRLALEHGVSIEEIVAGIKDPHGDEAGTEGAGRCATRH